MIKLLLCVFVLCLANINGEYLTTKLIDESNSIMMISSFGFLKDAVFEMNISLTFDKKVSWNDAKIGLRFDKSSSGGRNDYMSFQNCPLDIVNDLDGTMFAAVSSEEREVSRAVLIFTVNDSISVLQVYQYKFSKLRFSGNVTSLDTVNDSVPTVASNSTLSDDSFNRMPDIPVTFEDTKDNWTVAASLYFQVETVEQAGLYELYLHNCEKSAHIVLGKIDIKQKNPNSFLSAGDILLPSMYTAMAVIVFATSIFWMVFLWKKSSKVFTIHYLMAVFMFIKALSTTFHAIDYYFIGRDGKQEAWAVIFYILHLLKGTLLFICLLLIGTGWAFIKYVLSDREKKLFMIVIPLQIVANIAYMIQEESGFVAYNTITWPQLMFLFDILCFGVILISVSWSIRHLQDASSTDGKAAVSIVKLKLFQHFYVMVICYLYFRRVLVYLLQIILPFRYTWIHSLFYEVVSLLFFIITGYKFRPGCDNPYLAIPQHEDVESFPLTESGLTETLTKVNQSRDSSDDDDDETVVLLQRNKATFI